VGDTVTTRPRPFSGGRHNDDSPEGERRSHDSPEAIPGRETQSPLAQGQSRVGDTVMTHPRPTSGGNYFNLND
jgi:hypothetical protein